MPFTAGRSPPSLEGENMASILPKLRSRCYIARDTNENDGRGAQQGDGMDSMLESKKELREHKFQIGQTVYFTSKPIGHMVVNGTYRVMKLLPSDGEDYQYRIKSANEAFERVAKESQLDRSR
jgi:hypothetical protein